MQPIDRQRFHFALEGELGDQTGKQLADLDNLLGYMEADGNVTDLRHAAYMLATVYHETAGTYRPIAEYGKGQGKKYGIPDPQTGQTYYGRGFVQLTWKANYQAMSKVVDKDLAINPDAAMLPDVAYKIMSFGMRKGSFTGVGLSKYINGDKCDYVNARRIINGIDCADKIAGYAQKFEYALNNSTPVTAT